MNASQIKRSFVFYPLAIIAVPVVLAVLWLAYAPYCDWRYVQPWQKVVRGDSEEKVLALLGRPHRIIVEHSDKACWESEHKVDWYDAESEKEFRYGPFFPTGDEYGIAFDSSGHAVSKIHITSP